MTLTVIDGAGHVIGRLASVVAKRLLMGEDIVIVNADKAIVRGRREVILAEYMKRRRRGSTTSKMRGIGPFYPRRPDMILRRTISRMLPHQQARGRDALKRLRVYMDVPPAHAGQALEVVEEAKRRPQGPVMTLGEVSRLLGSKFTVSS